LKKMLYNGICETSIFFNPVSENVNVSVFKNARE